MLWIERDERREKGMGAKMAGIVSTICFSFLAPFMEDLDNAGLCRSSAVANVVPMGPNC